LTYRTWACGRHDKTEWSGRQGLTARASRRGGRGWPHRARAARRGTAAVGAERGRTPGHVRPRARHAGDGHAGRTVGPQLPRGPHSLPLPPQAVRTARGRAPRGAVGRAKPSLTSRRRCEAWGRRRQSTLEHVWYVRNLFAMLQYAPDLRTEVLSTTVDRLLQIDVRAARWPRCVEGSVNSPCALAIQGSPWPRCQTELQEADIVLSATDEDEADGPDGEPLMFDVEMDVRAQPPATAASAQRGAPHFVSYHSQGPGTQQADDDGVDGAAPNGADGGSLRQTAVRLANKLDLVLQIVFEYLGQTYVAANRTETCSMPRPHAWRRPPPVWDSCTACPRRRSRNRTGYWPPCFRSLRSRS